MVQAHNDGMVINSGGLFIGIGFLCDYRVPLIGVARSARTRFRQPWCDQRYADRWQEAAGITLFGDMLKGFLPVYLANALGLSTTLQAVIGLAAFFGHLYPIFFAFKGGKGVATSIGVLLGLSWWLGLAFIATWLSVYKLKKISSLSALTASSLSPSFCLVYCGR